MTEENLDQRESLKPEAEEEAKEEEVPQETEEKEDLAKNQEARYLKAKAKAEEAEAKLKKLKEALADAEEPKKEVPKKAKDASLSTKDLYSLIDAKVPQDDIDEVLEYANFKGISVGEALKSNVIKNLLSDRAEERKVSEAANTGPVKRSSSKASDESLLSGLNKGELPDSDDDMRRLIEARLKAQQPNK